jgi:hypothetical protein
VEKGCVPQFARRFFAGWWVVLCGLVLGVNPAACADLYPGAPTDMALEPLPSPSPWQFSFTPYGWLVGVNGNATARGRTVDINASFVDIVEESDSIMALMGFFEARKGPFSVFTDVVWQDLGFDAHRSGSGNPFPKLPNVNIAIKARAQLGYQSTIVQSGASYQIAKWQGRDGAYTALDLMGSARYWNEDLDVSLNLTGTLTADIQKLGLMLERSKSIAVVSSGTLEWVDPVVGARLRHQMASGTELTLIGDVGGFGVGSDFSWQAVGTYGFDVNCFGTPLRTVVGYRALAVDYSENGRFGKNGLDLVQHGPVMGISLRW